MDDLQLNQAFKNRIMDAIAGQEKGARAKIDKSWHWGDTGHIEMAAVMAASAIMENVQPTLPHQEYAAAVQRQFEAKADFYRINDMIDPEGYALGTLYAIMRNAGMPL